MWKTFFEICDFLCCFIPSKSLRNRLRTENLHDWKRKYKALKKHFPELNFRHTRIIKGGWNIGFVVNNKYVFKIRKKQDTPDLAKRTLREKRITDALSKISTLKIPTIEIIQIDNYTFYKYDYIPGKNLTSFSKKTIQKYRNEWAKQIALFVYTIHTSRPPEIQDLIDCDGNGWNHFDICNNMIVDPKTMKLVGVIDWEFAGWGFLRFELRNIVAFSKKLVVIDLYNAIREEYIILERQK